MQHNHYLVRSIEKFAYEKGTNVALYNAERSDKYQAFRRRCEKILYQQVRECATLRNMQMAQAFGKGITETLIGFVSGLLETLTFGKVNLEAHLYWSGEQGGQAALDKLNIDAVFGLKNTKLIEYFDDYANLRIKTVDQTTKEWIARTIQRGLEQNKTPYEIQQLLIDEGKGISKLRAERIVLTETAQAMKTVELITAKKNGIVYTIWRTSRDERVCPICAPLHGVKAKIGKLFDGEHDGPPAHVSCRCYLEEVIPDGWYIPDKPYIGE